MAHYVMGDIHGEADRFHAMLEKIRFSEEDTLILLGDVIDRGPDGIALLLEIMVMPNVIMLLGNHEYMMLQYLSPEATSTEIRRWNRNGNAPTLAAYLKQKAKVQQSIIAYLGSLPTHWDMEVNDKRFYLVHGYPGDNVHDEVWTRPTIESENPIPDCRLIIGHTRVLSLIQPEEKRIEYVTDLEEKGGHLRILHTAGYINLDCGCGSDMSIKALACIRLEDMKEFYDSPAVFYDGYLSDYEKTIYSMAIACSESGKYAISDEDIASLSARLCLNEDLLRRALKFCPNGHIPCKQIKMGEEYVSRESFQNADLFEALMWTHFVYENLSKISDGTSYDALLNNFQLFQDSIGIFSIINMTIATFECMKNDYYAYSYAVFNNGKYQPKEQLNLLHLALLDIYDGRFGEFFFPFLCRIMTYELITRVNSLYLILINQIVKHSYFFNKKIKAIASEMYYYLLGLAQNARVISVQTNYLPPLHTDAPGLRGRYDNTTRLQVLYGYENFDAYFLRLDLAHKGQGFIHYNNKSPGGVKCCLFTEKEYAAIVDENPQAEEYFIEYERRYALKEPHNVELNDKPSAELYEMIRKEKEHAQAFENTYDENSVVEFINTIASMLPNACRVSMDVNEEHANLCFQYEKIMFYSVLLEIAILSGNNADVKKMLDHIASAAARYGIITEGTEDEYASVEGVCLIIDEVKAKIALYQDL